MPNKPDQSKITLLALDYARKRKKVSESIMQAYEDGINSVLQSRLDLHIEHLIYTYKDMEREINDGVGYSGNYLKGQDISDMDNWKRINEKLYEIKKIYNELNNYKQ